MSRIDAAGVSQKLRMPGGMIAAFTSRAFFVIGIVMPACIA